MGILLSLAPARAELFGRKEHEGRGQNLHPHVFLHRRDRLCEKMPPVQSLPITVEQFHFPLFLHILAPKMRV